MIANEEPHKKSGVNTMRGVLKIRVRVWPGKMRTALEHREDTHGGGRGLPWKMHAGKLSTLSQMEPGYSQRTILHGRVVALELNSPHVFPLSNLTTEKCSAAAKETPPQSIDDALMAGHIRCQLNDVISQILLIAGEACRPLVL